MAGEFQGVSAGERRGRVVSSGVGWAARVEVLVREKSGAIVKRDGEGWALPVTGGLIGAWL